MKTTILRKEHQRALNYLILIDKINTYIVETNNMRNIQLRKDVLERFLFYPESSYLNDIIKYENILSYSKKRYNLVIERINKYM